jgi:hypothetical protein
MEKRISLLCVLLAFLFVTGCAGDLVFVQDAKLHRIKDDGNGLQQIIPDPIPPTAARFHSPDVSHSGDRVVFISGPSDIADTGTVWTMKIDGNNAKQVNIAETPVSLSRLPRWYPHIDQFIGYWGRDSSSGSNVYGIYRVASDLTSPNNGQRICDTVFNDYGGFDFNKPQSAPLQIIFSRYDSADHSFKLHRRKVEIDPACTAGSLTSINPYPPVGVDATDLDETKPVVSFSQGVLASAAKWSDGSGTHTGIRIRGIAPDGTIGVPLTLELKDFQVINRVAFAEKDKKIYFSGLTVSGDQNVYYIGGSQILNALSDLLNLSPADIGQPWEVDAAGIVVGAERSIAPSGIHNP